MRTGKDDLTQKKKINVAKNCHCRKRTETSGVHSFKENCGHNYTAPIKTRVEDCLWGSSYLHVSFNCYPSLLNLLPSGFMLFANWT